MKALIAEDDFASRKVLQKFLSDFGDCDVAVNGKEAVQAYQMAVSEDEPYDLICLDIMMPEMDGQEVLKRIREHEKERGVSQQQEVKIVMTTALDSPHEVVEAYYRGGCTAYLVKPIQKRKLIETLKAYELIP